MCDSGLEYRAQEHKSTKGRFLRGSGSAGPPLRPHLRHLVNQGQKCLKHMEHEYFVFVHRTGVGPVMSSAFSSPASPLEANPEQRGWSHLRRDAPQTRSLRVIMPPSPPPPPLVCCRFPVRARTLQELNAKSPTLQGPCAVCFKPRYLSNRYYQTFHPDTGKLLMGCRTPQIAQL